MALLYLQTFLSNLIYLENNFLKSSQKLDLHQYDLEYINFSDCRQNSKTMCQ